MIYIKDSIREHLVSHKKLHRLSTHRWQQQMAWNTTRSHILGSVYVWKEKQCIYYFWRKRSSTSAGERMSASHGHVVTTRSVFHDINNGKSCCTCTTQWESYLTGLKRKQIFSTEIYWLLHPLP